jgi:hypothetical protein
MSSPLPKCFEAGGLEEPGDEFGRGGTVTVMTTAEDGIDDVGGTGARTPLARERDQ